MLTSILLFLVVIIAIAIDFVAIVLLLGLGLRWAKAREWTWRRVMVTTAFIFLLAAVFHVASLLVTSSSLSLDLTLAILLTVAYWAGCVGIIVHRHRLSVPRAIQAWLTTWLSLLVILPLIFLFIRPLLFESFVSPSSSMAPTLLGNHGRDICEICGSTCYFNPPQGYGLAVERPPMICDNFHVTEKEPKSMESFEPSRFVVAKFLRPKRWDLLVFEFPANPKDFFVQRVVGLPGETVTIENGRVMIDGKELRLPDELEGLEYLSEMPMDGYIPSPIPAGSVDHPAKLADDEYFVLGDFSIRSYDSRLWQQGAEGRPPYAVPRSHVRGVVSHILWPPERFRVLR